MTKQRLEAFSDGVIAIILTVMVLEMREAHGADWGALRPVLPVFLSYVMGGTHFSSGPVALYGVVMLCASLAFFILLRALIGVHGQESAIATAVGSDSKGRVTLVLNVASIPLAFVRPWLACAVFVIVAVIWLIPDRRIEAALAGRAAREGETEWKSSA